MQTKLFGYKPANPGKGIQPSLPIRKLLVDGTNLLLHVETLQMVHVRLALPFRVAVKAVHSSLFAAYELVLGDGLASDGVKHVAALARKSLQVVGNVGMRNVGVCVAGLGLGLLFLPAGVKEFN